MEMKRNAENKPYGRAPPHWKPRSGKGILLTLLVIILFVLMLGEVISYIVITINYNLLAQSTSDVTAQGSTAVVVTADLTALLQTSLSRAVYAMAAYQYGPTTRANVILTNQTAATGIASLMTNGTLGGVNLDSYMGNAILANISNTLATKLTSQGISYKIQSSSLSVFQGTLSSVNATYTALAIVNSTQGTISYPISINVGVPLNGTQDISASQRQAPQTTINLQPGPPTAVVIDNSFAVSGSTSPFMFASGTAVKLPGTRQPNCATIPSRLENNNFILVAPDSSGVPQNACGMAGVIANVVNSLTPLTPYLVFASTSNADVFNTITNGTRIFLDGPALAVYNTTPITTAIQNNYYFTSPYAPSYLDLTQNALLQRADGGPVSFGLLQRQTPFFTDAGGLVTSNVFIQSPPPLPKTSFTITFWINKDLIFGGCDSVLGWPRSGAVLIYAKTLYGCAAGTSANASLTIKYLDASGATQDNKNSFPIPAQQWVFAAVVMSENTLTSGNANTLTWYINGNQAGQYTNLLGLGGADADQLSIGAGDRGFNGSIADVQIYNAPLSPFDISALYRQGIDGPPLRTSNVMAWYPLDGNTIDFSGYNHNGTANAVTWQTLTGYIQDPFYKGLGTSLNASVLEGVLGCTSPGTCANTTAQQLYINGYPLGYSGVNSISEEAAFGMPNAIAPRVLAFNGNAFLQESGSLNYMDVASQAWTASVWVYPITTNSVVAPNGVIIDEINLSAGNWHNSMLNIANGVAYAGMEVGGVHNCIPIGTVPANQWTQLDVKYTGVTLSGYLDGTLTNSLTATRQVPSASPFEDLGHTDPGNSCGGGGGYFTGLMSNFLLVSRNLNAANVVRLYVNQTVLGSNQGNDIYPLSAPFGSAANWTQDTVHGNYLVFNTVNGNQCPAANALNGNCGLNYVPG